MTAAQSPDTERRAMRVIAVTSGKGGVGKTNLSVNLAITFAQKGRKVLIVDGDVGLANVDILLDETPAHTLGDLLKTGDDAVGVEDVLVHSPYGVSVLPGTSGLADMSELSPEDRLRLMEMLEPLGESYDTVIVDTAAGIGSNARFFAGAAQEVLVVATPEPTSLADAYAMIKVLNTRCKMDRVGLILNQVANEAEAREVYQRLYQLTNRFLPVVLTLGGYVPNDPHVREAVMQQQPVAIAYPSCPGTQAIQRLADNLLMRPPSAELSGRLQFFWRRLMEGDGPSGPPAAGGATANSPT
ncbi:MAG: MinD/ParA family protein [Myxococcota bacterium]|nr:MinD/ParA family protein [Myxococcota bacterium]